MTLTVKALYSFRVERIPPIPAGLTASRGDLQHAGEGADGAGGTKYAVEWSRRVDPEDL